jgi:hypothetical protein
MFRRYISPPSSGWKSKVNINQHCYLLHAGLLLDLLFISEDGGGTFFRNVAELLLDYTASYPGRQYTSNDGDQQEGGQARAPSWIFGKKKF